LTTIRAADKSGVTGSGKRPMIYAVTPDKMTVHVPAAMIAQARQEIEAAAKRRLADEYDSAQERGEVAGAKDGSRGRSKGERPATAAEVGLDRKDIHDARQLRDVIAANPAAVREALDDILAKGDEPTRAALKRATAPHRAASGAKGARPIGRRAEITENAAKGVLPPVPDFSAETHTRFRGKLAEIVALVEAGDVAALKATEIKTYSSSPKAMARYRDLAVEALQVRRSN
jgi:hypothetical protein